MSENPAGLYQLRDGQGNIYGPVDMATLRAWVGQNRVIAGMHIASQADGVWVEVSGHPALADLFRGGAAVVAGGHAAQTPPSGPGGNAVPTSPAGDATPLIYSSDRPKHNLMGLLSMIFGIVGICGMPMGCVPFCGCIGGPWVLLFGTAAIILGILGIVQINAHRDQYIGRGQAMAGLIMGICAIVLYVVGIVAMLFVLKSHP